MLFPFRFVGPIVAAGIVARPGLVAVAVERRRTRLLVISYTATAAVCLPPRIGNRFVAARKRARFIMCGLSII